MGTPHVNPRPRAAPKPPTLVPPPQAHPWRHHLPGPKPRTPRLLLLHPPLPHPATSTCLSPPPRRLLPSPRRVPTHLPPSLVNFGSGGVTECDSFLAAFRPGTGKGLNLTLVIVGRNIDPACLSVMTERVHGDGWGAVTEVVFPAVSRVDLTTSVEGSAFLNVLEAKGVGFKGRQY